MKRTKRFLSLALALILTLGIAAPASAVTTISESKGGSGSLTDTSYALPEYPENDYGEVTIFLTDALSVTFSKAIDRESELYFSVWDYDDNLVGVKAETCTLVTALPDSSATVKGRAGYAYPCAGFEGSEFGHDWVYDDSSGMEISFSGGTVNDIFANLTKAGENANGCWLMKIQDGSDWTQKFYLQLGATAPAADSRTTAVTLSSIPDAELLPKKSFSLLNWNTVIADEEITLEVSQMGSNYEGVFVRDDVLGGHRDWGYYQTERAATVSEFTPDYLYNFPADMALTLTPNFPEGETLMEGSITLRAWSDPDGDGIYEQRICSGEYMEAHYPSTDDWWLSPYAHNPIPLSERGPFIGRIGECLGFPLSTDWLLTRSILAFYTLEPGFLYLREPVTITGKQAAELFGPNTLLEINVSTLTYDGVNVADSNDWHYHFYLPSEIQKAPTAVPVTDTLKIDNTVKVPTAYDIGGHAYFQLRDVAVLLNGTKAQFNVEYDKKLKAVIITTGEGYTPLGWELAGAAANPEVIPSSNEVYINGEKVGFTAYTINGANFFQLRDLGQALGFNVGWSKMAGRYIETDKPYTSAD